MLDLRSFFVAAVLAATGGGAASAQPSYDPLDPGGFSTFAQPLFEDAGYAPARAVRRAVGGISIRLNCPGGPSDRLAGVNRKTRVYLDDGPNRLPDHAIVNTIAGATLSIAHRECPTWGRGLGGLEIFGPTAADGSRALLLRSGSDQPRPAARLTSRRQGEAKPPHGPVARQW